MTPRRGRGRPFAGVPLSLVVAALLVVAGLVASVWRPYAPALAAVATDLDRLSVEFAAAIAAYRAPRVPVAMALYVLGIAVPVWVVASRTGRRFLDGLAGTSHHGWRGPARGGLVAAGVGLLTSLVALPLQAWAGLVHDGAWQVRTASAPAWWARVGTTLALEVGVLALVGAGVVWLVRRRPRRWVGDVVVLGVVGVAVATLVWPSVVLPLTTPVTSLGQGEQAAAVRRTLAAADLEDLPVVVAQRSRRDTRSNAVVHGLGPTRRIVIDDTLLGRPVDEVVAVVGHELAHQRHRDVDRAVLGSALLVLPLALAVRAAWGGPGGRRRLGGDTTREAHDPRLVAVVLAVVAVLGIVVEPVALWHSRRVEAAADATAFELGVPPATAVALQRRLAIDNLTPVHVPTWQRMLWWSHPSPAERIRASVARAAATGDALPTRAELQAEEAADPPAWSRPPAR